MPQLHPRRYRIEALILHALAPMVAAAVGGGVVTVRHVALNRDFSVATVVYAVAEGDRARVQQALDEEAWRLRRRLALELNMRKTPKLVFSYDEIGLAADNMRAFLERLDDGGEGGGGAAA